MPVANAAVEVAMPVPTAPMESLQGYPVPTEVHIIYMNEPKQVQSQCNPSSLSNNQKSLLFLLVVIGFIIYAAVVFVFKK